MQNNKGRDELTYMSDDDLMFMYASNELVSVDRYDSVSNSPLKASMIYAPSNHG